MKKRISLLTGFLYVIILFNCNEPMKPFINNLPECSDIHLATNDAIPVEVIINAKDPDGDPIGWTIIKGPNYGSVNKKSGNITNEPAFIYISENLAENKSDTIDVIVSDSIDTLKYTPVKVIVEIAAVDNPPIARDTSIEGYRNIALIVIPGNDPEGKPVTWKITKQPMNGSITVLNDTVSRAIIAHYIPQNITIFQDSFNFRVYQDSDSSNSGTVRISSRKAFLLQQDVPFNGSNYSGCEDAHLKVKYVAKDGIKPLSVMESDSQTNFSSDTTLLLTY